MATVPKTTPNAIFAMTRAPTSMRRDCSGGTHDGNGTRSSSSGVSRSTVARRQPAAQE
jgi:hypothetical protein